MSKKTAPRSRDAQASFPETDKLGPQTKAYQDLSTIEPKKDAKKPNYADVGALGGGGGDKPASSTKKSEPQSEEGVMPSVKRGKEKVLSYDDKDSDQKSGGGNYNNIPGGSAYNEIPKRSGGGHYDEVFAADLLRSGQLGNGAKAFLEDGKKK
eukprot:TRINITY_DN9234_c0_g1_i1.p1 TRINITY_DN9234_c0_g1~~TRINITY_DN9234_c0_g1_i1.p1  ORF type:complete len:153 (+),score=38.98 TRINITY_DN9234_c0_g1_i1:99-557(+)